MTAPPSGAGGWQWYGQARPPFADPASDAQESVWDYPRPPRLVPDRRRVVVRVGTVEIARTGRALRLCETASPPTWYLPWADVQRDAFVPAPGSSHCEWKGRAAYWSIVAGGQRLDGIAWSYPDAVAPFAALQDCVALYPSRGANCFVDDVLVTGQPGGFYGGWITPELVGPWKGGPGTSGW